MRIFQIPDRGQVSLERFSLYFAAKIQHFCVPGHGRMGPGGFAYVRRPIINFARSYALIYRWFSPDKRGMERPVRESIRPLGNDRYIRCCIAALTRRRAPVSGETRASDGMRSDERGRFPVRNRPLVSGCARSAGYRDFSFGSAYPGRVGAGQRRYSAIACSIPSPRRSRARIVPSGPISMMCGMPCTP